MGMEFVSDFDAETARSGVPSIFLRDSDGLWKVEANLTRDCWERTHPVARDEGHGLMRDRATGFVTLVYVTGRGLLEEHPRADITWFDTAQDARAALDGLGRPPIQRSATATDE